MTEAEFKRLAAAGLQPHPARARDLRRSRHAALALPQARQRAVLVPARVGRRRRALRPLFVHRPCRRKRASTCAATSASRSTARRVVERRTTRRSARVRRRYLARFRAAPRPAAAALLRRARRLLRLRHRAPHRDAARRRRAKPDPLGVPDILLLLSEELAVVDNLAGQALRSSSTPTRRSPTRTRAARERLQRAAAASCASRSSIPPDTARRRSRSRSSGFGEAAYHAAVARAKRYISDGDIMQVRALAAHDAAVRARRRSRCTARCARSIRRRTCSTSTSATSTSSARRPRSWCGSEGDTVTLRPIAGTRRAARRREEDAALAEELLADPKERAEHVMLVDLGRNDVGRVAQTGTRARDRARW